MKFEKACSEGAIIPNIDSINFEHRLLIIKLLVYMPQKKPSKSDHIQDGNPCIGSTDPRFRSCVFQRKTLKIWTPPTVNIYVTFLRLIHILRLYHSMLFLCYTIHFLIKLFYMYMFSTAFLTPKSIKDNIFASNYFIYVFLFFFEPPSIKDDILASLYFSSSRSVHAVQSTMPTCQGSISAVTTSCSL